MKKKENILVRLLYLIFQETCILPLHENKEDAKISLSIFNVIISIISMIFYGYNIYNFLLISNDVKKYDGLILSIGLYIQVIVGSIVLFSTQIISFKNSYHVKVLKKNMKKISEIIIKLNIVKPVNRKLSILFITTGVINIVAVFAVFAERNRDLHGFEGISVSVLYNFPMINILILYCAALFLVDKLYTAFRNVNKHLKKLKHDKTSEIANQIKLVLDSHEELYDLTYLLENSYGVLGAMLLSEILVSGVFFSFYAISVIMSQLMRGNTMPEHFSLLSTFWSLAAHIYIICLMIVLCEQCMSEVNQLFLYLVLICYHICNFINIYTRVIR